MWDASVAQRRQYREIRRADSVLAREFNRHSGRPGEDDPTLIADLDKFFDGICSLYLSGDEATRETIRTVLQGKKRLLGNLHNYAGRSASRLSETWNTEFLGLGLAAVSIENGKSCQNYGYILGRLYTSAAERGFDPSWFFQAVAKISENESRTMLENFESSEDFAVFVKPNLNK